MDYFSTGIPQVDKMGKLNISGNITPNIWYRTILTETGKPYYLAISILSDIVYWYKPAEIRDEHTGMVIGWKKRFKHDLLQRSYAELESMFGENRRTITRALVALEEMGIIKREFRDIRTKTGHILNNVLFLNLNVNQLYVYTYPTKEWLAEKGIVIRDINDKQDEEDVIIENPESTEKKDMLPSGQICQESADKSGKRVLTNLTRGSGQNCQEGVDKSDKRLWTDLTRDSGQNCQKTLDKSVHTNTENSTENTNTENTSSSPFIGARERKSHNQEADFRVKKQIEYDRLLSEGIAGAELLDEVVRVMSDIYARPRSAVTIAGFDCVYENVVNRFQKITYEHVKNLVERMQKNPKGIKSVQAYLLTALYNTQIIPEKKNGDWSSINRNEYDFDDLMNRLRVN